MKIIKTGAEEAFKDLPLAIEWHLTYNCNYRCSYCFIYRKGNIPQTPFSTLEQIKTAVDNIVSLNRPYYDIGLSGGEPTIHPHMFDIVELFHKKLGNRLNSISIVTNGSRNAALYEKLAGIAKYINFLMNVSIHTDHVEMDHILELIEKLSHDVKMHFVLMFNPARHGSRDLRDHARYQEKISVFYEHCFNPRQRCRPTLYTGRLYLAEKGKHRICRAGT